MSTMTSSVALLSKIPVSFPCQRNGKFQGSGQARNCVRMMSATQFRRLRIRTFSGLQATTSFLGSSSSFLGSFGPSSTTNFYTKMNNAMFDHRGRATQGVVRAMFERFTEKAIKVILVAQEESRRLSHNAVGTEQILLGLIGEGTGIAAKVLKSMGMNMKETRIEVEKIVGRGSGNISIEIPFSPRTKCVLELSLDEAQKLSKNLLL